MSKRLLVVAALALLPRVASADPKAEAKQHVDKAMKLHAEGKLAETLDELKTAYALDPQPELLYAMGQIHVGLGQCPQAITYYERYLATKPDAGTANAAKEAIDACKTNPPRVVADTKPESEPAPVKPDAPPVAPPPPTKEPAPATATASAAWYTDILGDALVGLGIVGGIFSVVEYRAATSDRSNADRATNYQQYSDLVDSANSKQTLAIVAGAAGAALVVGGAVHFMMADHTTKVAVTPAPGGGMVSIAGRF
jgi:tetratricopeptide (TPR) repeat protein